MRPPGIRWHAGERTVQNAIDEHLGAETESQGAAPVRLSGRRSLLRIAMPSSVAPPGVPGETLVLVKEHHTHSGPHRGREVWKRRLGWSPAQREWRALVDLHARGVAVPCPLAWGERTSGDALVAMEYLEGPSLADVLASSDRPTQLEWIERIALAVETLHRAGYRHGDLHLGNLHVHRGSVRILDLQRARRARYARERLSDLAQLDFSLARQGVAIELRRHLRRGLGAPSGLDAASGRFVRDFVRGRSRRELRVGRAWAEWRPAEGSDSRRGDPAPTFEGLRSTRVDEIRLDRALREAIDDDRPGDRRSGRTRVTRHGVPPEAIVVKRNEHGSRRIGSTGRVLGSTARRDFERGQRLAFLGSLSATPVATVDESRAGRPVADWLLLESVGHVDLDAYRPRDADGARRCLIELAHWIAEWHAWGVDHLDLKAGNIRMDDRGGEFRFWLIDVGDIRLRRRLHDRARLRALVQLNASLADDAFDVDARREALHHYVERLPFAIDDEESLVARIAHQSLSRRHRWRGEGCSKAKNIRSGVPATRTSTP